MTPTPSSTRSVAAQLAALPELPMPDLWALWDTHFPRRPAHPNRAYLEARIAYRIQEQAYGALPAGIRQHLVDVGARRSKIVRRSGRGLQRHLMPGTTLLREWDEREYRVTVTAAGLYELDGRLFKSLSAAARHITGTRWSGPRFFGLDQSDGSR